MGSFVDETGAKLDSLPEPIEAVELYNYLQNEFKFYTRQVAIFRKFEFEMAWGCFVPEYCEARLFDVAHDAAQGYCRTYCKDTWYLGIFPVETIKECAKMIAKEFEVEKAAGNSWLRT